MAGETCSGCTVMRSTPPSSRGRVSAADLVVRSKRVVTHGYKSNILIAANLHFLTSHKDEEILEYSTSRSPLRWQMTQEVLPVEADGTVLVPTRPGLGVTLDWDFVNANRWPKP